MSESDGNELWPSITFACKKCGKVVTTKPGGKDMRTVFCSKKCSDSYWKHRSYREKRKETRERLNAERAVERDVKEICPMCGVEFIAPTPNRVFCNPKCASMYHSRFGKHGYPIKRFTCDLPGCDKTVVTNGDDDRRYRFCCIEHARRFWLNPPRNSPYRNQKWHSVEEYASWERRTNGCE